MSMQETPKRITRRQLIKAGCATVAVGGLAMCGATALSPSPPIAEQASYSFGDRSVSRRILVAYATYAGSTRDVAAAIGERLGTAGMAVDVKPVSSMPVVADYDAVVIGSAVHHGNWLAEGLHFLESKREALRRTPLAMFCVHIRNLEDDEVSRRNRLAYLDEARALATPVAEGFFAGKFDRRGAELMLPPLVARFVPAMDFVNWEKIRTWADGIVQPLNHLEQ